MDRGIRNSESLQERSAMGAPSLSHEIAQFDGIGKLDVLFLVDTTERFFFLLLISENISETQTFSVSNTSTLQNFPKLETTFYFWKALETDVPVDNAWV